MQRALAWLAIVGMAVAAGCASAPPEPVSMRAPDVDFSAFRSFAFAPPAAAGAEAPVSLLDGNLRAAIADELVKRGYVPAGEGKPDLLIDYATASKQQVESNPVRIGVGMGSWGGSFGGSVNVGSPALRNYQEGSLLIHGIDAARNAEVWQGRVEGRVDKDSLEPESIRRAVAIAMRDFPARR